MVYLNDSTYRLPIYIRLCCEIDACCVPIPEVQQLSQMLWYQCRMLYTVYSEGKRILQSCMAYWCRGFWATHFFNRKT